MGDTRNRRGNHPADIWSSSEEGVSRLIWDQEPAGSSPVCSTSQVWQIIRRKVMYMSESESIRLVDATEEDFAAMNQRMRKRQEERREMADIDAFVRVVNSCKRAEVVGVIVPLEKAREFKEFQRAQKMRGNWQETAVMVAASLILFAISIWKLFA